MSGSNNSSSRGGLVGGGLLALLFIGLKLGKVIDWSWWWVLSPLWISVALFLGILAVGVTIALVWPSRRRRY